MKKRIKNPIIRLGWVLIPYKKNITLAQFAGSCAIPVTVMLAYSEDFKRGFALSILANTVYQIALYGLQRLRMRALYGRW